MTEKDLIQSLLGQADKIRVKIASLDKSTRLCDLHKIATLLEKLVVAVDTCIANSCITEEQLPTELVEKAREYISQYPNCTLAQFQRHFKISFHIAGRLWEMLKE